MSNEIRVIMLADAAVDAVLAVPGNWIRRGGGGPDRGGTPLRADRCNAPGKFWGKGGVA